MKSICERDSSDVLGVWTCGPVSVDFAILDKKGQHELQSSADSSFKLSSCSVMSDCDSPASIDFMLEKYLNSVLLARSKNGNLLASNTIYCTYRKKPPDPNRRERKPQPSLPFILANLFFEQPPVESKDGASDDQQNSDPE